MLLFDVEGFTMTCSRFLLLDTLRVVENFETFSCKVENVCVARVECHVGTNKRSSVTSLFVTDDQSQIT